MIYGTIMVVTIGVYNKKCIHNRIQDKGLYVLQPNDSNDAFNK